MTQTWHDLLFAHWPVPSAQLRGLVPQQLALDTFNGQCWVAVAPFRMTGIRMRWFPPLAGLSRTPELNVRTYVVYDGKPGVYFFSLDAASAAAVWAARKFFYLPYFSARISMQYRGEWIQYSSRRVTGKGEFMARYRPAGPIRLRTLGTLEHWLTERYCLYTARKKNVYRAEIHHLPWPLQDGAAEIEVETMSKAGGIELPASAPLLHFSKLLRVLIWPLHRIT